MRGRQAGMSWEAGEGRGAGGPSEEYGLHWKGKGEPSKFLQKGILGGQGWEWNPGNPTLLLHSEINNQIADSSLLT